jgi:hypothetical protein
VTLFLLFPGEAIAISVSVGKLGVDPKELAALVLHPQQAAEPWVLLLQERV